MCINDLKFVHPFTSIVSGMSTSGKTTFVKRLLKNWEVIILSDIKHLNILWCYAEDESRFSDKFTNASITFHKGIPNLNDINKYKPNIIVIDDLMDEIDSTVRLLYTRVAHQKGISVILMAQNLFNSTNKFMRTVTINSHYIILTNDLYNIQNLQKIASQYFIGKLKQLYEIFNHATSKFGYLIINKGPRVPVEYRLRTRIFREELSEDLSKKHSFCPVYYPLK